ncbi:MAG: GldG family protein [Clostridia bacterium]|nr:GldG family protein [Clostridia bacterium]
MENNERKTTLRNQFMLKKGTYTVAITALVLAALILVNWLVDTLGKRFHLEYDMTPDKSYSVNGENLEYIKNVNDKITITVLSAKYSYVSNLSRLAAEYYYVSGYDDESYYEQTLALLEKYGEYNDNIKIEFLDISDAEANLLINKYKNDNPFYGDMIVSCESNERYKVVRFADIYQYDTENVYYQYAIQGNNLETALAGAIAYCVSARTPKCVVFTGHSSEDYSQYYTEFLKKYNYDFDVIGSQIISEISDEYDMAVIVAPTADFIEGELDLLSSFLKNGGKLSKGLIYFGSICDHRLPNLEEFLAQWGIVINGYIAIDEQLKETPYYSYMISEPANGQDDSFDDSILSGISQCITTYNIPLETGDPVSPTVKVNGVMKCSETTIIADMNESGDGLDYSEIGERQCYTVIESRDYTYDENNNLVTSYVYAFSSLDFIGGQAENEDYQNKNITLACSDRAAHFTSEGLNFITKTVKSETFIAKPEETNRVRVIFQWALPLIIVAISIFIYVKRRNA